MGKETFNPQKFFITYPAPCPYLAGRLERKLFTYLEGPLASQYYDGLVRAGFRRSQKTAYRPLCDACQACVSVRIPAADFIWRPNFRRVMRKNQDLVRQVVPLKAQEAHFELFKKYLATQHMQSNMCEMTFHDYEHMLVESAVYTMLQTYSLEAPDGQLETIAIALIDELDDGVSMVYSFYDPSLASRSLGTFMILDQIAQVAASGRSWVYLGYWIKDSESMSYKSRFKPQEHLGPQGWVRVGEG